MAEPAASARTLVTRAVGGDACCAAAAADKALFVVGTYTLDEAAGLRRGLLYLFQLDRSRHELVVRVHVAASLTAKQSSLWGHTALTTTPRKHADAR